MANIGNQTRIEQAWTSAKSWVANFNGTPTAALLVNAPAAKVPAGLAQVAGQAQNLRITIIPADKPSEAQFVPLESAEQQVERLLAGDLAELSVNWAVQQEAFDLDLHLVAHPLESSSKLSDTNASTDARLVSLQIDWWSDQVFSEETDNAVQFAALAQYFLELQQLFEAANLFISAESSLDPQSQGDDWVEI